MAIFVRPAELSDIPKLSYYFLTSSRRVIEWLYKDVLPDRPTNVIVEHIFTRFGSAMDFTNCWMAEDEGGVVGGIHVALGSAFSSGPADLMIPEDRKAVVGPIRQLRTPEAMHVLSVGVEPNYRSRGVGKTMMFKVEELARQADTNLTSLNVRGDNHRAIELYSRIGYVEIAYVDVSIPNIDRGRVLHMVKQF